MEESTREWEREVGGERKGEVEIERGGEERQRTRGKQGRTVRLCSAARTVWTSLGRRRTEALKNRTLFTMTTTPITALDWQLSIDTRRLAGSPATGEITSYDRRLKRSNSNLWLVRSCYPEENWPFLISRLNGCMRSRLHALGGACTRLSCCVSGSRSHCVVPQ